MIHVIYSDHAPFLMSFLRGHVCKFSHELGRKTEKGTTKWLGKSYTRLITQLQHQVYKAGKLTIYSRKFLALPAGFVTALITSCLERQCAVVSKSWAVPPVSLNSEFEALSRATTQRTGELCFLNNIAIV